MKVATYFQKFEKNQNKGKIRENDPVYNFDFTRKITFQKHAEIQNVGKKFVKYLNFQSDSSAFTSFLWLIFQVWQVRQFLT